MKVKRKAADIVEGDLTPMIDMTFQLIAFFMVLINFAQTESNDKVVLPSSQLVKPPEKALEFPIILHVARDGGVTIGGEEHTAETLGIALNAEISVIRAEQKSVDDANVIIRAHQDCAFGDVQEIISVAQEKQLTNFALRVKENRQ
ncbi:MAG: biopolymer transporter ExbD [Planctomycetota bacterium]